MKLLIFILLISSSTAGFSQGAQMYSKTISANVIFNMSNGLPIDVYKYSKITSGSAYFTENWSKASVYITDSTVAQNVKLRLDLLEGSMEFMNDKDQQLICVTPIYQVVLPDTAGGHDITKRKYFTFIPASRISTTAKDSWYQLLSAGPSMSLLKGFTKEVFESSTYLTGEAGKEIRTSEKYFVMVNNVQTRVKKFSDIIAVAGNKAAPLQKFISTNNLSVKSENDLVALVDYYHTLN